MSASHGTSVVRSAAARRVRASHAHRRGVLMLAVLVVLAVAALVAGGLMAASEAEHAGLTAMRDRTQQRAIAWSGCQAVTALLSAQRQSVADGEVPELPEQILLFEADGAQAMALLLPVGPAGERLVPEGGKFPLVGLDPAYLEATGVVDQAAASAAVARGGQADAIEAIVQPDAGLTADRVIGPVASGIAAGVRKLQDSSSTGGVRGAIAARVRPLVVADVATPFAAPRALGVGVGGITAREPVGAWRTEAMAAIDAHAGPGIAEKMRAALGDEAPANQGALVKAMRTANVPVDRWGAVLDAVVAGNEAVERGQVDVSSAPEEVLRAIPAIGAERAAKMVQARASLGPAERSQVSWPVTSGALTPEEFEAAAPSLCARSWLWRARVATGVVDRMQDGSAMHGIEVWEVVIDLGESPARFASIRDCTLLPVATALAEQERTERESRGEKVRPDSKEVVDAEAMSGGDDAPDADALADAVVNPPASERPDAAPDLGEESADSPDNLLANNDKNPRAWKRPTWNSAADEASRRAIEDRQAQDDAKRDAQRAAADRRTWKPAEEPKQGSANRTWETLADRERKERETRSKEWETLGDREKKDRASRSKEWETLASREQKERAVRSKEWKSLFQREREERDARDAAELARREAQARDASSKFHWKQWDDPMNEPGSDSSVASRGDDPGRDQERTASSGSSTGGLSGRWRRRSDPGQ